MTTPNDNTRREGVRSIDCSAISLEDFQKEMEKLHHWSQHGCTNHGCRIEPPKGMGTNSTCHCTPRAFAEHLLWLACELDKHGKYGRWPNEKDDPR